MNPNLQKLQAYPFERLSALKKHISPPSHLNHISLSIGEPKHPAPKFVKDVLANSIDEIERYPTTRGTLELRNTICNWLTKRFNLTPYSVLPDKNVLPVCGTREAIFAFTQSAINVKDCTDLPVVVAPNPFYQIYEGAALLAGAEPVYLNCDFEKNFSPDLINVSPEVWERCQLLQLCSPGNPTGAVMSLEAMEQAIHLADKYDFIIASDECYSEVYLDEQNPPVGLLEACRHIGRDDYSRCVVFHSLSKRSNLPGLRSGFIAGDASLIAGFLKYRTYHGSSMSLPVQKASIAAWSDEDHTVKNRELYRQKFSAVTQILSDCMDFPEPNASFYLWAKTPINDIEFARELYASQNVTLLPGQFLSRPSDNCNPGQNRVRMALVADTAECVEAALRIKDFISSLEGQGDA